MKTENIMIRITPQLKEQIRQQAISEGKTLSEWVTDLIKIELKVKEAR